MILVDSYPESNYSGISSLIYHDSFLMVGQSFTGNGGVLNSVKFYLDKYGSPTGNIYARIYNHSGTFGTSSIPTGDPIAGSDAVDVSTLGTNKGLVNFNFSGANKIPLRKGVYYIVEVFFDGGDQDNEVAVAIDNTSPTHDGNYSRYHTTAEWSYSATSDTIFYVYSDALSPFPSHKRI